MTEYQIIVDVEIDTPESILNHIVETISDELKKKGLDKYATDVYWDDA